MPVNMREMMWWDLLELSLGACTKWDVLAIYFGNTEEACHNNTLRTKL